MIFFLKRRIERYLQYLSDDNAEKTSQKAYNKLIERLSWNQRKMLMEQYVLNCQDKGITDMCYFPNCQVIVSLTTYGKRLYEVYLAIESIMHQTVKPNRIILWLQDDFQNKTLPFTLRHQQERGLEIDYCKDIKSYKKLIPTLQKFPNDIIITIDDDIIFSMDMLENLLKSYRSAPEYIHTNRAHLMKLRDDGFLEKYLNWEMESSQVGPSSLCFPTGGGGCLYPPHSLSEEVFNEEAFMSLCPQGDDIWFKTMSLLKGTQCYKAQTHDPYLFFNPDVQDNALWNENIFRNDIQIANVFNEYDLYNKLAK